MQVVQIYKSDHSEVRSIAGAIVECFDACPFPHYHDALFIGISAVGFEYIRPNAASPTFVTCTDKNKSLAEKLKYVASCIRLNARLHQEELERGSCKSWGVSDATRRFSDHVRRMTKWQK